MQQLRKLYKQILSSYICDQNESNLYIGQNLIKQMIQKNVSPEDVISIHKYAIEEIHDYAPDAILHGFDFLIEVMVHYGLKVKEHQSLLVKQEEMRMEMAVAANIQNHLLENEVPKTNSVDIGMISVPLRKMNGDYVHFMYDSDNYLGVAVTDVVGKGVPAALCMSMVKYGLDTLEYANSNPSYVLEALNQLIEKSVDDSMFVSFFYARYNLKNSVFTWSSAGHEPSLYYQADQHTFYNLEANGLLLGILPEVRYSQQEIKLKENDFVIIITDGVTDFRNNEQFDARDKIKQLALSSRHLGAQEMCDYLYNEMLKLHNFQLEDDFTVVIIKK